MICMNMRTSKLVLYSKRAFLVRFFSFFLFFFFWLRYDLCSLIMSSCLSVRTDAMGGESRALDFSGGVGIVRIASLSVQVLNAYRTVRTYGLYTNRLGGAGKC